MIKNIFFDIGNVLIHIHPDRYIQYLADSADLPVDVIKDAFPLEVHYAYERGEISGHEFFLFPDMSSFYLFGMDCPSHVV